MDGVTIDLDRPAPVAADEARGPLLPTLRRATPAVRAVALVLLALGVAVPQSPAPRLSVGRTVPLPSFCTGTPIPGGRLNLLRGDTYIILDATTNTIISTGPCPHRTAGD
ncbi:hypothetical protein [Dactylosporangium sp. CA-092794]|uniref:hypothetical protein n=1 Tax=Dactylosporangium sp. CA-092794 TaxID=3239929 RepID=UPI003D904B45